MNENDSGDPVRVDWGMRRHDATLGSSFYGQDFEYFQRGDASGNGLIGVVDAFLMLSVMFTDATHECYASLDYDDNGSLGLLDGLGLLYYVFVDGDAPPAPYPDCDRAYRRAKSARGCSQSQCE